MTELKVEGYPGLVRDPVTKAIIVKDANSFSSYQTERAFRENVSKTNQSGQEELKSVKQELNEIKSLLYTLFQKIEQRQG
jgi:hypothetical protein